jgi:hypothetical protein
MILFYLELGKKKESVFVIRKSLFVIQESGIVVGEWLSQSLRMRLKLATLKERGQTCAKVSFFLVYCVEVFFFCGLCFIMVVCVIMATRNIHLTDKRCMLTEYFNYEPLTWPEVAELQRDTPLIPWPSQSP